MHQCHTRAVPPEIQCRNSSRVLSADDDYVQRLKRVRLIVVVTDLVEVFAWNPEVVRQIVVSGGNHELAGAMLQGPAKPVCRMNGKVSVAASDALDRFVLPHVQLVVLGDLAVVLQRLVPVGLLVRAGEGNAADLQQLRRGEEGHVRGIVEQRVAQAALVDQHSREPRALRFDRAGESSRPRAYHQQVDYRSIGSITHTFILLKVGELAVEHHQLMRNRKQRQLQPRRYAGLVEDVREVPLHGLFADGELLGDVLVAAAFDDAGHDLKLPRRQPVGLALGVDGSFFISALQRRYKVCDAFAADPVIACRALPAARQQGRRPRHPSTRYPLRRSATLR